MPSDNRSKKNKTSWDSPEQFMNIFEFSIQVLGKASIFLSFFNSEKPVSANYLQVLAS